MKRIKQIIEALKITSRIPSAAIRKAADDVLKCAGGDGRNNSDVASDSNWLLVSNLMDAVVALAEDMEKAAKAPETN